ncbi:MAG: alpha-ketoglutarate-dependent dioxygenase AlkB [Chitinophagales bacterium]|nr:alpha-ketoglutarate-dependent dioxygenase AlkB [Chitinophagales bacterium]
MSLFPSNPTENLLPFDGTVNYFGKIIPFQEANCYYDILMNNIEWRNDEAVIFGKHIITARKVAWYADANFSYTYSKTTKQALAWTKELLALKEIIEQLTNEKYNSCLLNLYHNGNEGMAYHSDAETALRKNGAIASLSFGAERKFSFKHKTNKQTVSLFLEHGSLLVMKDVTQTNWLHRLPPTTKINTPRINLTFRQMMV